MTPDKQARVPQQMSKRATKREPTRVVVASQWQLMWWKFRKHRLAVISLWVTGFIYFVAIFTEFLAPFPAADFNARYPYAPPQPIRVVHRTDEGLKWGLHVNGYTSEIDPASSKRTFITDVEDIIPIGFFVKGEPYKLWGLIPMERHLFGPLNARAPMYHNIFLSLWN